MQKLGVLALALVVAAPASPQASQSAIQQWEVPFGPNTRPRDPFVAPDGRIFFVGQVGNYLASFDPKTSEFKKFEIPAGTLPHSNIVTPDGTVWLSGNGNGTILKLDPKNGSVKVIPVPLEGATRPTDPHTMIYDGHGGIWFTSQQSSIVGYLEIQTEKIRIVRTVPAGQPANNPYGIVLDHNGQPWFDLFRTNKIGTIDPTTFVMKTYDLPEAARPRRIARTSDGAIWYTDYARCSIGRLDVATGKVDDYPSPSGGRCYPYAMVVDDADRVWYVETGVVPNRMIAVDSKTRKVVYNYAIPGEGANSVRHMVFDPKTRQIWYGADLNFLGAVKVPGKPAM